MSGAHYQITASDMTSFDIQVTSHKTYFLRKRPNIA